MKTIIFNSRNIFNNNRKENEPSPSVKNIPKWFLNKDLYKKTNGEPELVHGEKFRSWKSCPALMDTFLSGYILKTPCDILIRKIDNNYEVITEKGFESFCGIRGEEDGFPTPSGYENIHFYWVSPWMPKVPKGYTTLYTHPLNRYDLPFLTISGFVDCEEFSMPGRNPFFIKKNFEGFISAGTPYCQIIPFLQEEWNSEIIYNEQDVIENFNKKEKENLVSEIRTNYKEKFWIKKRYE